MFKFGFDIEDVDEQIDLSLGLDTEKKSQRVTNNGPFVEISLEHLVRPMLFFLWVQLILCVKSSAGISSFTSNMLPALYAPFVRQKRYTCQERSFRCAFSADVGK